MVSREGRLSLARKPKSGADMVASGGYSTSHEGAPSRTNGRERLAEGISHDSDEITVM
jgi:hypothetical protein